MALTAQEEEQLNQLLSKKRENPASIVAEPRELNILGRKTRFIPPTSANQIALLKDLLIAVGYDLDQVEGEQNLDLTTAESVQIGSDLIRLCFPDLAQEFDIQYLQPKPYADLLRAIIESTDYA